MDRTTGYSGTPLPKKLGFTPGTHVLLVAAPDHYHHLLAEAEGVTFVRDQNVGDLDAAHIFLWGPDGVAEQAADAISRLRPGGMLWLSWAKKASSLHAGVTEDDLRRHILPLGWVDVKVCAVDPDWSGLKFLKRKEKRG